MKRVFVLIFVLAAMFLIAGSNAFAEPKACFFVSESRPVEDLWNNVKKTDKGAFEYDDPFVEIYVPAEMFCYIRFEESDSIYMINSATGELEKKKFYVLDISHTKKLMKELSNSELDLTISLYLDPERVRPEYGKTFEEQYAKAMQQDWLFKIRAYRKDKIEIIEKVGGLEMRMIVYDFDWRW